MYINYYDDDGLVATKNIQKNVSMDIKQEQPHKMTANNSSYTVGAEDTDAQIYACSDRLNTNMQRRYRRVAAS